MDNLIAKYKSQIRKSGLTAEKLEKRMSVLSEKFQESIEKNVLLFKNGYYLPSRVNGRIMDGKHKTVLSASRDVYKASQVFQEIKEIVQIRIIPEANDIMTDMKSLRDSVRAEFQMDMDVLAELKTVKNLDNGFDILFKQLTESYDKVKNHYNTLIQLLQYVNDGLMTLGSISKFLYNYSQMEMTEMHNDERIQTNVSSARDSVMKDLMSGSRKRPVRGSTRETTISEESVGGTRRSRGRS